MTAEEKRSRQAEYNKKWRRTESGKRHRYDDRNRYYAKTRHLSKGRRRWTLEETEILLNFKGSDEELAYFLCRSVSAIQCRRCKIKEAEN